MCDLNSDSTQIQALLVATPDGLAELLDAVEKALSHPEGRASVEMQFPTGEKFKLHIVCQVPIGT